MGFQWLLMQGKRLSVLFVLALFEGLCHLIGLHGPKQFFSVLKSNCSQLAAVTGRF